MSALVQWAKFDIPDVNTENVIFDRLLTLQIADDASLARENFALGHLQRAALIPAEF